MISDTGVAKEATGGEQLKLTSGENTAKGEVNSKVDSIIALLLSVQNKPVGTLVNLKID